MKTGAFFDVDGTLYKANMWRGLVQYANEHGRQNAARYYWASKMPVMILRKLNLIDEETFRKPFVSTLGILVKGYDQAQGDAAFRWVAEQYIQPTGLNDIIACLRDHVTQGHVVVLVSAMLAPTLQVLGENLGVTGTVGTQVEFANGRYTGRVILPVCMGVDKAKLAKKFLQARGIEIDFAASYAYADSFSDLSLFEMVGHPTPVYPDAQLAAYAKEKNWQVLGR